MGVPFHRATGNSLLVHSIGRRENRVDFVWPVANVLDCGDVLVVRIDPHPGSKDNENVFGVNDNAVIVWKVPARICIYEDSPYTGIKKEGDNVRLFNWDGAELLVNPSTGEVLQTTYSR